MRIGAIGSIRCRCESGAGMIALMFGDEYPIFLGSVDLGGSITVAEEVGYLVAGEWIKENAFCPIVGRRHWIDGFW